MLFCKCCSLVFLFKIVILSVDISFSFLKTHSASVCGTLPECHTTGEMCHGEGSTSTDNYNAWPVRTTGGWGKEWHVQTLGVLCIRASVSVRSVPLEEGFHFSVTGEVVYAKPKDQAERLTGAE